MNVLRVFSHHFNPMEVARQEWELARQDYTAAARAFDGSNPRKAAALAAASDRRGKAWDCYWKLIKGR